MLTGLSACELARRIRAGEVSAREAVEACLSRITLLDDSLGAFLLVMADEAREAASRADALRMGGAELPPLHGVPVAAKDVFVMPGTVTTIGQRSLADYRPPGREALSVSRLREAGAIVLGKTAVGSGMRLGGIERERLPAARNPWDPERTPGGSSSGSAVAVATGMSYGALGTDVGGSIRNPASFSGIVGLKPSYGIVPLAGNLYGVGTAFEHVGPMARTVADTRLLLAALADPGSPVARGLDLRPGAGSTLNLRVALAAHGGPVGATQDVQSAVEAAGRSLEGMGASVEVVELPEHDAGTYRTLVFADQARSYAQARSKEVGAEFDSYNAFAARQLLQHADAIQGFLDRLAGPVHRTYDALFDSYDLLVLAVAPITARRFDEPSLEWAGRPVTAFDLHAVNTWMFNMTGHPALSLPWGFDGSGLPVGVQMVARRSADRFLLTVAERLESDRGALPTPGVTGR